MRLRLLLSFLLGAAFFTVLPIYAPPILLQTTDMAPFLLVVLACAFVGACLVMFGYLVPRFGLDMGGPSLLADAASYAVLLIVFSLYLALPAGVGVGLV